MIDGDISDKLDHIDARRCPLYLLTGEYDYSCTTEGTLDVARSTGAQATIMKDLGHFPMSENPEKFIGYLLPVLEEIRAGRKASAAGKPKRIRCIRPPARPTRSSRSRAGCAMRTCPTT